MKIGSIIFWLLCSSLLTNCYCPRNFTVRTNSSDVVYTGMENSLFLVGHNLKKVSVISENSTVGSYDSVANDTIRRFYLIPTDPKAKPVVKIKNGKSTTTLSFRQKRMPDPIVTFFPDSSYAVRSGDLSLKRIRKLASLTLIQYAFDYTCEMAIISYQLTEIKQGQKTESAHSGYLTPFLKNAQAGDIYIFHDVVVEITGLSHNFKPLGKEQRTLPGLTIIVEN
jgi:hypothetical protein